MFSTEGCIALDMQVQRLEVFRWIDCIKLMASILSIYPSTIWMINSQMAVAIGDASEVELQGKYFEGGSIQILKTALGDFLQLSLLQEPIISEALFIALEQNFNLLSKYIQQPPLREIGIYQQRLTFINILLLAISVYSMSKSYLGENPQLYRKVNTKNTAERYPPLEPVNMQEMAEEFILEEKEKIHDIEMRIRAYEVKIKQEKGVNLDHSAQIEMLEEEVKKIRREEGEIVEQISNCRKVQNQVAPMEYYLWKKKQRINTYDASIAQLCREVQQHREYLQRSIEEHRRLNEEYFNEIEQLEQRIANFNYSQRSSINPLDNQQQELEELFTQNIKIKEQCSALSTTNSILEENRQIVGMQIVDNANSMLSSINTYYQQEKTKLVKQFKQLQAEAKTLEVSPLSRQQQTYTIEPLLNDYAYKMSELLTAAPEQIRKFIQPLVNPLSWKSFNWSEFIEINSSSESIYDEYTRLEKQFMVTQKETQSLQAELKRINGDIASQYQKYNQISVDITKLKKKLEK